MILTFVSNSLEILALAMIIPITNYNGERGKQMKYVYYAFYPVHLLVLALICIGLKFTYFVFKHEKDVCFKQNLANNYGIPAMETIFSTA
jgi:hypothetical protein